MSDFAVAGLTGDLMNSSFCGKDVRIAALHTKVTRAPHFVLLAASCD